MSILAQNHTDEVALLDCIQKFFAKHHVGKLLKQCNGTKEKGVPSISLLKYKLGNIFIGRSMYTNPIRLTSAVSVQKFIQNQRPHVVFLLILCSISLPLFR